MSATNANARFTYCMAFAGPATNLPLTQGVVFCPDRIGASGGTAPYTYAITAGSLPSGIELYPYPYLNECYLAGTTGDPAGDYPVTITATDSRGQTASQTYTLVVRLLGPAITGLAPANGPATGGTPVTLTGAYFAGATNVAFGSVNIPASDFTVVDASHITLLTPPGKAGLVDVTVSTPWGASASDVGTRFTYHLALQGIAPAQFVVQGVLFIPGLFGATGGTAPYTYAITTGSLPDGLGLYPYFDRCYFHGITHARPGSYPVTVTATDSQGLTGSQVYTLVLDAYPSVVISNAPTAVTVATTSITLTGGCNDVVMGMLVWTNALTHQTGTVPAGAAWSVPGVCLACSWPWATTS